jgi:hypothetical protein
MAGAGDATTLVPATLGAATLSRSPNAAQSVAGLAITGSTPVSPLFSERDWVCTSCTAREPTMKAPRNPAAMETALRLEEEVMLVTSEVCCQTFSMGMKSMNRY